MTTVYDETAMIEYCSKDETRVLGPWTEGLSLYTGDDLLPVKQTPFLWQQALEFIITNQPPKSREIYWSLI
jgi:hypothetical protein